ncbi:MAG: TPR repeat protein [Limisphaerales bacterium]|jgi:TPR repeat protein
MIAMSKIQSSQSVLYIRRLALFLGLAGFSAFGAGVDFDKLNTRAEAGEAKAQFEMGLVFERGLLGQERDLTKAFQWYASAAPQGHVSAQNNLATLYTRGKGVERNYGEAVKWYRVAAMSGNDGAQNNMGWMYQNGLGVPQDYQQALSWYLKSAETGNSSAQNNLGILHYRGWGVPSNYNAAAKWYLKGAEQGNPSAQSSLGSCYLRGHGVPKDPIQAYKWCSIAAAGGDQSGRTLMENISRTLTPGDLSEAQKQAAAFKPKRMAAAAKPKASQPQTPAGLKTYGTGFFITRDGYLLTNLHVIQGARKLYVRRGGESFHAQVIKVDRVNDMAVLKVEGEFTPLPLLSSRLVSLGESVFTIGFPNAAMQGLEPKLTRGEINSLSGAKDDPRHFQMSVAIQPGNSGGPLVTEEGNVVGVVTRRLNDVNTLERTGLLPQNVNYALKSSFVLAFLEIMPALLEKLDYPAVEENREFKDIAKEVQAATALVLGY